MDRTRSKRNLHQVAAHSRQAAVAAPAPAAGTSDEQASAPSTRNHASSRAHSDCETPNGIFATSGPIVEAAVRDLFERSQPRIPYEVNEGPISRSRLSQMMTRCDRQLLTLWGLGGWWNVDKRIRSQYPRYFTSNLDLIERLILRKS